MIQILQTTYLVNVGNVPELNLRKNKYYIIKRSVNFLDLNYLRTFVISLILKTK
jgi:hypothetical protein